jgi:inosine-uridine nucleoside N-ribohydrolase
MSSTKVLLDTDIGSDIDDAVCLAYLLAQSRCELLGITTVSGQPELRAQMASAQCIAAGKRVPIFPGAEDPLLVEPRQAHAPQAMALARWEHETRFERGQAVEFLRQVIRTHPGEVTLLTIGPLTNIALLFKADPEVPSLLESLVMMGGHFLPDSALTRRGLRAEWNIWCDPHAAAIVYGTAVDVHRSIGLDVTLQVTMAASAVRQRFDAPPLRPVLDFAEVWFKDRDTITFHDPLAATTLFDDRVCGFERGDVRVETFDPDAFGVTRWQAGPGGAHEVATSVDVPRFFERYFEVFAPF